MTADDLRIGGCTVRVLPVIKGLLSETKKVEKAFDELRPDKVAISLSKEEIEGLRNLPVDYEPELSRYEEIYASGLSRFGEVAAPPPCYLAALKLADRVEAAIVPVDLDEQSYTELYCAAVPGTTIFRHSTRTWLLKRKAFSTVSAEDFVRAWDRAVNKLQGFELIERKRAEAMAKGIKAACDGSKALLAVIELERADDVLSLLKEEA